MQAAKEQASRDLASASDLQATFEIPMLADRAVGARAAREQLASLRAALLSQAVRLGLQFQGAAATAAV